MCKRSDVTTLIIGSLIISTIYGLYVKNHPIYDKSHENPSGSVIIYDKAKTWHTDTMILWCKKKVSCLKMAEAVYFEARGEGDKGMRAVAHVINNRVKKSSTSVTEVVMKDSQFSYTRRKDFTINERGKYEQAMIISAQVLTGLSKDVTNGSTHFVAPKRLKKMPKWTKELTRTLAINNHVFYRG